MVMDDVRKEFTDSEKGIYLTYGASFHSQLTITMTIASGLDMFLTNSPMSENGVKRGLN
jgi:hypothetical protein